MAGRFYHEICKRLGVTEAGLRVLFRLKRGDDVSGGNAGIKLEEQGYVTRCTDELVGTAGWYTAPRKLTDRGLAVCEKARKLGY